MMQRPNDTPREMTLIQAVRWAQRELAQCSQYPHKACQRCPALRALLRAIAPGQTQ